MLYKYQPKPRGSVWICKCDCGKLAEISGGSLRTGNTISCGCFKSEATTKRNTKHGGAHEKLYQVWFAIKKRCLDPRNKAFKNYGARGITMYSAWLNDFGAFQKYISENLGPRPSSRHSLDRINNDGHYEPGNLRWANDTTQARNTRSNQLLAYAGETKTIAEWAELTGIGRSTIWARITKLGWPVSDALRIIPEHGRNNHVSVA